MDKMNDLKDLLKHEIQDLYSVEEQIIAALPLMIDKASNISLKNALTEHLRVTEEQKNRLDKIQKMFHEKKEEKKGLFSSLFGGGKQVCKGMEGIISEGNKMMNEPMDPSVLDAVIIASAQKVEHYEICGYGTVLTYARELKLNKVVALLEETLNEEYQADELLTLLAESGLNQQAESRVQGRPVNTSSNERSTSESSRSKKQERNMEPVSDTSRSSSKSSGSRSKGGSPKSSEAPRNSGGGRSSSGKQKTQSSGSSSQSKSGRGSQSSSGRGGNGKTGRGR